MKRLKHKSDIRHLLEVKNAQPRRRQGSVGSDGSDASDLSTQSMPQYSSYRQLSGGLLGPFENSPSRPSSRGSFLPWGGGDKHKTSKMSVTPSSRLKTPTVSVRSGLKNETLERPSSATPGDTPLKPSYLREVSGSKLPLFKREISLPQMKPDSAPSIKRESSEIKGRPPITNKINTPATPRGSIVPINPKSTPKTVAEQRVSERNIATKGTRNAISGVSDNFTIGDDVGIKGTNKKGKLLFIGETRFAKGCWAGVVLDDDSGKNDGSVAGVRYFSCPPLRGVFVKEEKLEKFTEKDLVSTSVVSANVTSDIDSDAVNVLENLVVGDHVQISMGIGTQEGTLQYIGLTGFAKGTWCGVELREPNGKNDGAVAGTRYFQCEPKHGIFAQLQKVHKIKSSSNKMSSGEEKVSSGFNIVSQHNEGKKDFKISSLKPITTSVVSKTPPNHSIELLDHQDVEPLVESKSLVNNIDMSPEKIHLEPSFIDNDHIKELEKKLFALQSQLHNKENELQNLKADKEKTSTKILREQECTFRLQNQVSQNDREKLEMQNELNEYKHKIEDLRFQLEELAVVADEKKISTCYELDKVIGLENKLNEKEKELRNLQFELEKCKHLCEEETFKLDEKDMQLHGKNQEVEKLRELLQVAKLNETSLVNEVTNLKRQSQELRSMQISMLEVDKQKDKLQQDYDNKLLEREKQNSELKDLIKLLENQIGKLNAMNNEKDAKVSSLEIQVSQLREELSITLESKGALNKQIYDLNKELESKRIEVQSVTASNETLRKEHLDIKARLEVAECRNDQHIEDKKKLEEEILKVSKNSGDNAQQLMYHNQQIQLKNGEIAGLQDKLATLTAENHKQDMEMKNMQDKMIKEKQFYEKEKTEEVKKLRESITIMEEHFKKLKTKNEEIEQSLKNEQTELQKSKEYLNTLKGENASKHLQITLLTQECEGLGLKITEGGTINSRIQIELDNANKLLLSKDNEIQMLTAEIECLQHKAKASQDIHESTLFQLNKLSSQHEDMEVKVNCSKLETKEALKNQDALLKVNEELRIKVEELTQTKQSLQAEKETLECEKSKLFTEAKKLREEVQVCSDSSRVHKEELLLLRKQMTDGSSCTIMLEAQLHSLKEQLNTAHNSLKKVEKEYEDMTRKQLELVKEQDKLQADLCQKCEQEIEQKKEAVLLRDQLKQALEREQFLRNALDTDRQKHTAGVENEIETLRKQVEVLEVANASLTAKLNNSMATKCDSSKHTEELRALLEHVTKSKNEKEAEIGFLNSIIVDLQKKNKDQEEKIKILSYGDDVLSDDSNHNITMSPIKPNMRMRPFCDICDVFDVHDTEDCPTQTDDSYGGVQHRGSRTDERPYCVICESFGHTQENCDDEQAKCKLRRNRKRWLKSRLIAWKQSF